MAWKIRLSRVEPWARVMDSVQPVHSWNGSQITDGRRACSSAAAMRGTVADDRPISEAVAVRYCRKPRRVTRRARRNSPSNGDDMTVILARQTPGPRFHPAAGGQLVA